MTAWFDSTASKMQKASWQVALLIGWVLLITYLSCNRGEQGSVSSTGIDPAMLTQHGQLHFVQDAKAGRRLSKELGKPCLLFFTADWCTYCQQMEKTAFTDSAVGELSGNFICVLVDADRQPKVCQDYSVTGYPTIQFVSSDGRVLNRLVGRQSAPDLAIGMRAALKRFAWLNDPNTRVR
jgi:thiol:disulfide interchange protein